MSLLCPLVKVQNGRPDYLPAASVHVSPACLIHTPCFLSLLDCARLFHHLDQSDGQQMAFYWFGDCWMSLAFRMMPLAIVLPSIPPVALQELQGLPIIVPIIPWCDCFFSRPHLQQTLSSPMADDFDLSCIVCNCSWVISGTFKLFVMRTNAPSKGEVYE